MGTKNSPKIFIEQFAERMTLKVNDAYDKFARVVDNCLGIMDQSANSIVNGLKEEIKKEAIELKTNFGIDISNEEAASKKIENSNKNSTNIVNKVLDNFTNIFNQNIVTEQDNKKSIKNIQGEIIGFHKNDPN